MHESDPELTLALHNSLNRLKLAEDYCDMFDRLVDMSDIASFGAGPGEMTGIPGVTDPAMAYSRALIYPGATAFAYINEIELRQIRARSRVFAQTNPYAIGAARNRMAYAVGSGHTYNVLPRNPHAAGEAMLDDCRKALEDFRQRNKWSRRQKETVRRLDRDGERFLRLFVDETRGELNVRFVEPLEIQNPPNKTSADGVYFGIQFAKVAGTPYSGSAIDIETPVGYFLVNIGTLGESIGLRETVPAREMQHLKANVDITWPRGLPTWYALQGHLHDAVKTLKATGQIVEFRARIGMIRRHINATKKTVEKAVHAHKRGAEKPAGVRTAAQYPYAAIIDTSDATEYQFPSAEAPVDKNVAAIQAELRAAAAALAMPEYMLSGDASNANFSSTMVAEGPAVKTFEELQADLIAADVEIMERQLAIAARAGLIHGASEADILERVKVEAEPPIIKSENRLQEAQADQILLLSGVMSKESMAARHGLVYADERDKMEIERGNSGHAPGQLSTRNSVPSSQPPGAGPRLPAASAHSLPQGLQEYSDDQPRDYHGRWTVGGGGNADVLVYNQPDSNGPQDTSNPQHPQKRDTRPLALRIFERPADQKPAAQKSDAELAKKAIEALQSQPEGKKLWDEANDVVLRTSKKPITISVLDKVPGGGANFSPDTGEIQIRKGFFATGPGQFGATPQVISTLVMELVNAKHSVEYTKLQDIVVNHPEITNGSGDADAREFATMMEEIEYQALMEQWDTIEAGNKRPGSTWGRNTLLPIRIDKETYLAQEKATGHFGNYEKEWHRLAAQRKKK